jgi:hypothetical protein
MLASVHISPALVHSFVDNLGIVVEQAPQSLVALGVASKCLNFKHSAEFPKLIAAIAYIDCARVYFYNVFFACRYD